ncbi:MAG: FecR domain-containing protein [Pseudomonadota bacterium]
MKNDDQEAVDLLRQMGRLGVPLLTPEREAARHERMASSVNSLLQRLDAEPAPRRLPVRTLGAVAALAASVGLWVGAHELLRAPHVAGATAASEVARVVSVSGGATLVRVGSMPSALIADQLLSAADELRSGTGARAALALSGAGKAKVEVAEDTRLRLNQHPVLAASTHEDWLDLEQGLVTLQVAKLAPGLGLAVQTPDARVIVHGTRFSVQVSQRAPSGTVTSVAVTEGRVEVDSLGRVVFLGPGEHWSSQSATPKPAPAPASGAELPPNVGPAAARVAVVSPPRTLPTSPAAHAARGSQSTLAEENRLYTQALARAGGAELPSALSDLATLIQRYPRSPLAQNARVERFRLLQQSGNGVAAAEEARRYLSEYPSGFARNEARSLALVDLKKSE